MKNRLIQYWHSARNFIQQRFESPKTKAKRRRRRAIQITTMFVAVFAIFAYATNPFVHFSIIQDPYHTIRTSESRQFDLGHDTSELIVNDRFFARQLAFFKSGWHIISNKFTGSPKAPQAGTDEVIATIHQLRFNPEENPFLISGDHFSVLYPRSLGIFYHSLLDPRTALDETDWEHRQLIYLKTTAYALQVYDQSEQLSTTIVPIAPKSVALMNIYALPSDTLYSLLTALDVMQSEEALQTTYPFAYNPDQKNPDQYSLMTQQAAAELTAEYQQMLERHLTTFLRTVVDPGTGLVKKDITLSGTKDIVWKKSGFYDNVMVWKSIQLSQKLGIVAENQAELDALKRKIIDNFWDEERGYFIEDLSDESLEKRLYSSDWLIAYQTGFLDPANPDDLPYLQRSIDYVMRNGIDQPFGLQYSPDQRRNRHHGLVRIFAPDYGSTAIWSHWGMEYTKLLAQLALVVDEDRYLTRAEDQIDAYTYNIKRYRGYPEVYDKNGDFFKQGPYKSIRQTGWVVNFEQARAMVEWTKLEMNR